MRLITVSLDSIRFGEPLPYALRDAHGTLLANKGYIVDSKADLEKLVGKGFEIFVDIVDAEHHRSYINRLHHMVTENKDLGVIAGTKIAPGIDPTRMEVGDGPPDWLDLQAQANSLLRDTTTPYFLARLDRLQNQLQTYARRNPNGALFALFHLSASEIRLYSATHAMLVGVMCGLAAREVFNWPQATEEALWRAALSMNVGMTDLQDRLAAQLSPPTPDQRKQIDRHALRSVELLEQAGVQDRIWLDAVRDHHAASPGPMAGKTESQRLARLIQRADMFGARLAPRASRVPTAPAAAMQACYFDENRQVDEAGAALIKAVGIYSPGSFVRLSTNEIAIVIQRGINTTTPKVAVLVNREGIPLAEPIIRDTALRDYRIVASVPHRDVKVKINLQRLLPLTITSRPDRF